MSIIIKLNHRGSYREHEDTIQDQSHGTKSFGMADNDYYISTRLQLSHRQRPVCQKWGLQPVSVYVPVNSRGELSRETDMSML
ncbi:hypothetical protein ScPMuIL_009797 [Solemya velum]